MALMTCTSVIYISLCSLFATVIYVFSSSWFLLFTCGVPFTVFFFLAINYLKSFAYLTTNGWMDGKKHCDWKYVMALLGRQEQTWGYEGLWHLPHVHNARSKVDMFLGSCIYTKLDMIVFIYCDFQVQKNHYFQCFTFQFGASRNRKPSVSHCFEYCLFICLLGGLLQD